jgi:DNA replication protein DnaC
MAEVVPTATAQRRESAEDVRALLAEEAAGRDAANLGTRRTGAAFPTGTFHIWNEEAFSIPVPKQTALRTLEWVGRWENLGVVRPPGTGKSHHREALGQGHSHSSPSSAEPRPSSVTGRSATLLTA